MRNLALIVDAQQDFMQPEGALYVPDASALIAPINRWLASLRPETTAAVLFTYDTHDPARYADSPEATQFPPHCLRDTPGWQLAVDPTRIDPAIPVWRLEKPVFDMWAEQGGKVERVTPTELVLPRESFFHRLHADDVNDAVVVGVAADYCVRQAVAGLLEHRFRVTIPASLTRGIERQIEAVRQAEWADAEVVVTE